MKAAALKAGRPDFSLTGELAKQLTEILPSGSDLEKFLLTLSTVIGPVRYLHPLTKEPLKEIRRRVVRLEKAVSALKSAFWDPAMQSQLFLGCGEEDCRYSVQVHSSIMEGIERDLTVLGLGLECVRARVWLAKGDTGSPKNWPVWHVAKAVHFAFREIGLAPTASQDGDYEDVLRHTLIACGLRADNPMKPPDVHRLALRVCREWRYEQSRRKEWQAECKKLKRTELGADLPTSVT